MRNRQGFALLTVLWLVVSATALTTIVTQMGRDSYNASRNRINAERALWRAEGCLALARATIDSLISSVANSPTLGTALWRALDTAVTNRGAGAGSKCAAGLQAIGSRINVNGDEVPLRHALGALVGTSTAATLVDALIDWRDPDSLPRPLGAEVDWYVQQTRFEPRNDSLAALGELPRVRGFENLGGLEDILGVEPGRISIANAPASVLAAIPGFTQETVALIGTLRAGGQQINDVSALASSLSQPSSDTLLAHFSEISRLTVLEPEAWIVTAVGAAGTPPESVWVEIRVVRTQDRAVIVRRRSWL